MKVTLFVVGKTVNKNLEALINDYISRLKHYVAFEFQVITDLKNTKSLSESQQKAMEGEQILRSLQPSDMLVLLDEHGKELRSIELAQWLEHKMQTVCKRLVLVIGGPYGFSDEVYKRANEKLSLSKMTFSHQMIRLIIAEQLYRAMTIIKGEPYHHE